MHYVFEYGDVLASWRDLAWGLVNTIWLSGAAMAIGLVVSILGALGKVSGPRWLVAVINAYIEAIRNTPFLIQIFLVFFGLPLTGIRLESDQAALLALVINLGAYGTEIMRAGVESIGRGQIEAGRALGMKPLQIFRHIILLQALQAIYPALTSQFILLMLNSSVCSAIAASELTAAANDIQSRTFRSFEVYSLVTVIYLLLSLTFSLIFRVIERTALRRAPV